MLNSHFPYNKEPRVPQSVWRNMNLALKEPKIHFSSEGTPRLRGILVLPVVSKTGYTLKEEK